MRAQRRDAGRLDLAALGMRLVVVPLDVDDGPDNVAWYAGNAQARRLIVENSRFAAACRGSGE